MQLMHYSMTTSKHHHYRPDPKIFQNTRTVTNSMQDDEVMRSSVHFHLPQLAALLGWDRMSGLDQVRLVAMVTATEHRATTAKEDRLDHTRHDHMMIAEGLRRVVKFDHQLGDKNEIERELRLRLTGILCLQGLICLPAGHRHHVILEAGEEVGTSTFPPTHPQMRTTDHHLETATSEEDAAVARMPTVTQIDLHTAIQTLLAAVAALREAIHIARGEITGGMGTGGLGVDLLIGIEMGGRGNRMLGERDYRIVNGIFIGDEKLMW